MKDLTVGKTSKVLIAFCLPMFASVVFTQLYNIVDSMIAGKFAGEAALASVGASYPVIMIFMAIAIGVNIGSAVLIGRCFGAKEYEKMKSAISTTIVVTLGLAILSTIISVVFCEKILILLNTPADILEQSTVYLKIFIYGIIFLYLYNVIGGIFNALGDSMTPLVLLIFSTILNIVLDLLFVIKYHMGVSGVAWATFIAQGASFVLASIALVIRLRKIKCGSFSWFNFGLFKQLMVIAIPSILQQSFISIGNIFVQAIINGYGTAVIAGFSSAIKLNTFALMSITTISNALSSFTAQNLGAGKSYRIKEAFKSSTLMSTIIMLPFFIFFCFFSKYAIGLFLRDATDTAMQTGTLFLTIVSPFYMIIGLKIVSDGILRGMGKMTAFMISTFSDLILRVVMSYILARFFGAKGVFIAWPIGWIIGTIIAVLFYVFASKKLHDTAQEHAPSEEITVQN